MNEAGWVLWTRAGIKPRVVSASAGGSAIRACHVSVTMCTVLRLPLGSLHSENPGVFSVAWLTCAPSKPSSKAVNVSLGMPQGCLLRSWRRGGADMFC
jgi:hypothetical protein